MKFSKKNTFKKICVSLAVSSIITVGSIASGLAAYIEIGTLTNFTVGTSESTTFSIGTVPGGTQVDQISSYPTIFNNKDTSTGYAYARSTGSESSFGFGEYCVQKNNPSPYSYRYVGVPAGKCTHIWSNNNNTGFRANTLTAYRYTT